MPPKDSLRLHYLGQIKQIGPDPRDPYQQRPVTTVQPPARRRPPQGDVELMTKKQILGFEPASRLEHGDDEHSELMQDPNIDPNDVMILPHDANPCWMEFSETTGE